MAKGKKNITFYSENVCYITNCPLSQYSYSENEDTSMNIKDDVSE